MTGRTEVRLHRGDVRCVVVVRNGGGVRLMVFADDDEALPLVEARLSGAELEELREALDG